jgi:hypothetical protein
MAEPGGKPPVQAQVVAAEGLGLLDLMQPVRPEEMVALE